MYFWNKTFATITIDRSLFQCLRENGHWEKHSRHNYGSNLAFLARPPSIQSAHFRIDMLFWPSSICFAIYYILHASLPKIQAFFCHFLNCSLFIHQHKKALFKKGLKMILKISIELNEKPASLIRILL